MSTSVDLSFSKQFEAEVKEAYQQRGSKLRNTVRFKNNISGKSTTFQKIGKGTAGTKTRNGFVPVMNLDHAPVDCLLTDYYAGDYIDKLDELKVQHDERKVATDAGAFALGRKTDDLIIAALKQTTQYAGDFTTALTKTLILSGFKTLNATEVPDDGQRFAIVGANQWNNLLNITEFADSDFVGDQLPWLNGTTSKNWLGITWMLHNALPITGNSRSCYLYHKTAIGHASGQDVTSEISYENTRAAWFANNMMSQGACLIDALGVVELRVNDTM